MVFDKTKAMRNAERYIAQGKIQSAIGEYRQVVDNDPKDFGTMNMLGDLYTKNADMGQAIRCYTAVAEHYAKQGFAHKAIAVYNKITKIQPNSIEIAAKLADLYRFKGSLNEARSHYKIVAEHFESKGRKLEALEVRKQMASLDPNDTAVYLNLASAFLEEGQTDEAADAFNEAGLRFAKKSDHVAAIVAFEKALELKPYDQKILAAFIQSHFASGTASVAAERLAEIHSAEPHDRELLQLLIDCQIETGDLAEAEKSVISLVEKEPAAYSKLLDLARIYLKNGDAESAARVMAMSAEHLLLAGEVDDFQELLTALADLDPSQLEGLRLRARLAAWQRDEAGMHDALAQLASVARERDSVHDERYALSQLVMIAPQQVEYADRLREINELHGFDDTHSGESLFDSQFMKARKAAEPELESAPIVSADAVAVDDTAEQSILPVADFAIVATNVEAGEPGNSGPTKFDTASETEYETGMESDHDRLLREVDSIKFYIESGYLELAGKAIGELQTEFGESPEVAELERSLKEQQAAGSEEVDSPAGVRQAKTNGNASSSGRGIDDLRSELGLDEVDSTNDSDYDTHYHTAVAYQEMGLLDEAVREFQDAVGLVRPNDQTRRFFQCANLLGHCFMQKAMPNLALKWFQRALETPGLTDEEKQGIWYELAAAYEADGDLENAGRYFEQVYAENIDFRDVSARVRNMAISR